MSKDWYGVRGESLVDVKKDIVEIRFYFQKGQAKLKSLIEKLDAPIGKRKLNSIFNIINEQLNRLEGHEKRIDKAYTNIG